MYRVIIPTLALITISLPASAQVYRRQAAIVGNNEPGRGRCVARVVVDGAADVTIQGDSGSVRDLSGRPAQWQRLECTGAMPANPANVQFRALEGRGSQQLVRDPRNGGVATVRIEDKEGGSAPYTFELDWGNAGRNYPGYPSSAGGYYGDDNSQWRNRQAQGADPMDACRAQVRQQAAQQLGSGDIVFENSRIDRRGSDHIEGTFVLRSDRDRDQSHRFVCPLDPDGYGVGPAVIDPNGDQGYGGGSANREMDVSRVAVQSCRRAVDNRMREQGFSDVRFGSINMDNRRNDWVEGAVRGDRGNGAEYLRFGCRVDPNDGDIRSVDLHQR